jgi:hypothetical protein
MAGGEEDDSDVEVALVCPSQYMGGTYDGAEKPGRARGKGDDSYFSIQQMKQRLYAQTCECLMASTVLIVVLGLCVLSFFYCRECLLGILVLSACLCPWIPYFNIPLWVSIGMLVVLGFHFTNKVFTFMWE